jgi:O-antigen ligase
VVAGAIPVLVAPDRRAALGIWKAFIIEPIVFAFIVAAVSTTVRRAAFILAGLAVAAIVGGVANSIVVLDALRHHRLDVTLTPPVVIYMTANAVALFVVPLAAVAGGILLHSRDRTLRIGSAAFLVVALPSVLLSFSRGGYLAIAAVAVGLALTHRRRWLLLGVMIGAGVIVALLPPVTARIAVELTPTDGRNTLVGRFALWSATIHMLRDHPIFGAGLSGFTRTLAPYWSPSHVDTFMYPHNIVLTAWSETGLLGLIAFIWLLAAGFITAWRGWIGAPQEWRPIQLGVLLALVAVVAHGLVDVPYWKNDLSLEFWTFLGLSVAATRAAAGSVLGGEGRPVVNSAREWDGANAHGP